MQLDLRYMVQRMLLMHEFFNLRSVGKRQDVTNKQVEDAESEELVVEVVA